MSGPLERWVVLDDDAKRFLRRTGVLVIAVEAAVLAGILIFQRWFGH